MMYGFGDVKEPLPESIELVEQIAQEFITELVRFILKNRKKICLKKKKTKSIAKDCESIRSIR